jgi:hypothetical protein
MAEDSRSEPWLGHAGVTQCHQSPPIRCPWKDEDVGDLTVRRVPKSTVVGLGLPPEAIVVLTETGIPTAVAPFFFCDLTEIATVEVLPGYRPIGTDAPDVGSVICVHAPSGSVWSVDAAGEYSTRFVNSGLREFVRCLHLARSGMKEWPQLDEPHFERSRQLLVANLHEVDVSAFGDSDNWWPAVVDSISI